MIRIRNSRQYQDALARVEQLQSMKAMESSSPANQLWMSFSQKDMNELLALGSALDAFELANTEPRDRAYSSR